MSSARRRRRVLLGLFAATGIVATLVLVEVIATVFFAITVAYVIYPVRQLVVDRGRGRRVAAAVATLAAFLAGSAAVLPILIQRENPALPANDERSDGASEPRTEQGGSESRQLREYTATVSADRIFHRESQPLSYSTVIGYV